MSHRRQVNYQFVDRGALCLPVPITNQPARGFETSASNSVQLLKELKVRELLPTGSNVFIQYSITPGDEASGRWSQLPPPLAPPEDFRPGTTDLYIAIETAQGANTMLGGDPKLDLKIHQRVILVFIIILFVTALCGACYGLDHAGVLESINSYVSGLAVLTAVPAVLVAILFNPVWLLVKVFGEPPIDRFLLFWNKPADAEDAEPKPQEAQIQPETETAGLLGGGGA